ncbi:MAG TPA: pyridoxamine 5'-phosphate oxidase family protein [Acidimicrobiales bacterium]|nr:pyridoxamine 5'-phosphate oxidase family protein [Acidimicrobiales bacterium]
MTAPGQPAVLGPGKLTKVRRLAERASYDRELVYSVLDEAFICHVATLLNGEPVALPTAYARVDDAIYLHGAPANATLERAVGAGMVSVTVTLLDGLVLARSTFHHSINYRSVVVFGPVSVVTSSDEKRRALEKLVEHIVPGRSRDARAPTEAELRATAVVKVEIAEASAKVRTGGPSDDAEDVAISRIWAGQLPLKWAPQDPVPDEDCPDVAVPDYIAGYRRPGWD